MAKKSKNTKKSRFGNPARAAADAATRTTERPSADARLDRAMSALSAGYVDWLESESRPDKSIDISLAILDDFFDMYRILEPHPDPTNLVPAALQEVLEVTAHANPLGVMTMRNGVHDYIAYLAETKLWTGTHEDLMSIFAELQQADAPESDSYGTPAIDLYRERDLPEGFEFAEIHLPELSPQDLLAAAKSSPLWKNTLALMEWIGEGRELTDDGVLIDQDGAAATLTHTGLGKFAPANNFTTPADHAAARLALYWELLEVTGLITLEGAHARPTSDAAALSDEAEIPAIMTNLISHLIYTVTLAGSEEGIIDDGQVEMVDWLTQAASANPPTAALLIEALEQPNTVHPDLVFIAQNLAFWAEEGLVTVGEFVEVPPAWRPDVYDMLRDDFPLHVGGPGAEGL